MKTISNFKKATLMAVATVCIASMIACHNDSNKDDKPIPTPTDAYGLYDGKMAMFVSSADADSLEMQLKLNSDTIYLDKFPVDSVVVALEGAAVGTSIMDTLPGIKYKIGYIPEMNAAQDSIYMDLKPKSLTFAYNNGTESKSVKVTMQPTEGAKSSYELAHKHLNFNLLVTEVSVNDKVITPFESLHYSFVGNKK